MRIWNFFAAIARAVLPEPLLKWLRGDLKSVHRRWIYDPLERLDLLWFRLRGGTYLEWYSRRMDRFAVRRRSEPTEMHDDYFGSGAEDLEVIKRLGVLPQNDVHEFGCGTLRSARFFIEYLEKGRFSANDASGERIAFGIDRWRQLGLTLVEDKAPLLIASPDNSFNWLNGRTVDYVWCHAVFGHMPPEDIEQTIGSMKKILKPGGAIIFTYGENPYTKAKVVRTSVKDWYHSLEFFECIAAKHGMTITECSDEINKTYPNDDVLIMRPL